MPSGLQYSLPKVIANEISSPISGISRSPQHLRSAASRRQWDAAGIPIVGIAENIRGMFSRDRATRVLLFLASKMRSNANFPLDLNFNASLFYFLLGIGRSLRGPQ